MNSQEHGRRRYARRLKGCAALLIGMLLLNPKPDLALSQGENRLEHFSIVTLEKGQRIESLAKMYHTTAEKIRLDNVAVNLVPGATLTIREGSTLPQELSRGQRSSWSWPALGLITQDYGWQGFDDFHHGVDLALPAGTVIRAARPGKVVKAGWAGVYGLTVIIDHGNGMQTLYAHNQRLLVKNGQQIEAEAEIAEAGRSGKSSGPHLHLEFRIGGKTVDPNHYLPQINLAEKY